MEREKDAKKVSECVCVCVCVCVCAHIYVCKREKEMRCLKYKLFLSYQVYSHRLIQKTEKVIQNLAANK